jgi:crossover junction endodeoxyribonuclease RusA
MVRMSKTPIVTAEDNPSLVVFGRPVPKGRPRLGKGGHVYTPQATRDFEEWVGISARVRFKEPIQGDVAVRLRFYLHGKKRGDIDNYWKAVSDGMNGIVFKDDRQVVKVDAEIVSCPSGEERTEVWVRRVVSP